jgi:fatty-acyl-CoA synthase
MPMPIAYTPLRTLRDIEELERVPLEERIFSWDLNDWIARGCALDPDKVAIRYIADGDPDSAAVCIRYGELQSRATQAANLFRSLGVSPADTVMFVLPTLLQLYVAMLGAVAAGIACGVNWMLKPEQLGELVRATNAKVLITLGSTPGYEIWENVQAIRSDLPRSVRILTGAERPIRKPTSIHSPRARAVTASRSRARSRPTISPPMCIPAEPRARPSW